MLSFPFSDVLKTLKGKINELKYHPFFRNEQMPENAIFLHVDYVENYENKQQGECQPAYFERTSFSIFTAVAYIRLNGKTENKHCQRIRGQRPIANRL